MSPKEILANKLIGTFISRFNIGDTWDLEFGAYHLVTQNVISENEAFISELLKDFSWFADSVDKENISKSAIVAAYMRREVIGIEINESCDLIITFWGGLKLNIPTDVNVVDWQWCINKTGKHPYEDYIVACFYQGSIEVNEATKF
jgi:hypothetical protein